MTSEEIAALLDNHEQRLGQLEENAFGGRAHLDPVKRVLPLPPAPSKAEELPLEKNDGK